MVIFLKNFLSLLFFSQVAFTNWLKNHLLRCPFKYITGIDCPGCGFQRSCIALLNGNFKESLIFYPATIPILITATFLLFDIKYRFKNHKAIKNVLYTGVASIIIISYGAKLLGLFPHYEISA
jgi:hypothetical protein